MFKIISKHLIGKDEEKFKQFLRERCICSKRRGLLFRKAKDDSRRLTKDDNGNWVITS